MRRRSENRIILVMLMLIIALIMWNSFRLPVDDINEYHYEYQRINRFSKGDEVDQSNEEETEEEEGEEKEEEEEIYDELEDPFPEKEIWIEVQSCADSIDECPGECLNVNSPTFTFSLLICNCDCKNVQLELFHNGDNQDDNIPLVTSKVGMLLSTTVLTKKLYKNFENESKEKVPDQIKSLLRKNVETQFQKDLDLSQFISKRPIRKTFESRNGVHKKGLISFVDIEIPLEEKVEVLEAVISYNYILQVRLFDDGYAFRYHPDYEENRNQNDNENEITIWGERSSWKFTQKATLWYQENSKSYEGIYQSESLSDLIVGTRIGPPTTLLSVLSNGSPIYISLTEANLANYSGMSLLYSSLGQFRTIFQSNAGGWKTKLSDLITPWRVALISTNLNDLVNSDIIEGLCDPDEIIDSNMKIEFDPNWMKGGKSVWHWWSVGDPILEDQKRWIDQTKLLKFDYYLIDDGWNKWGQGLDDPWTYLRRVVQYAKDNGVKIWIWCHYKDVVDLDQRREFFKKASSAGIVGIKIDFMNYESVPIIKWYDETLYDAAKLRLMINFHGANKPTGRRRIWPNEMTREGVRGHEYHITRFNRTLPPEHDCILPFTRYLAGYGDYTPTVLNPTELRGISWTHELAQAIIFTSPIIHFADNPTYYLNSPFLDFIQELETEWDETRVLEQSSIGEVVAFARRKGKVWFIGIFNGGTPRSFFLDCSNFLKSKSHGVLLFDDPLKTDSVQRKEATFSSTDIIKIWMRRHGGFAAKFSRKSRR